METSSRFYAKTKSSPTTGCLEWTGAKRNGYGTFKYQGKAVQSHRFVFELNNLYIPSGLLVCHSCDNKACVNIEHLFLGTQKDNMQDCLAKNRYSRLGNPGKRPIRHGIQGGYRKGCRCELCKRAYSTARKIHYKKTGN